MMIIPLTLLTEAHDACTHAHTCTRVHIMWSTCTALLVSHTHACVLCMLTGRDGYAFAPVIVGPKNWLVDVGEHICAGH